jgi:iron complex transport system permease protein
MRENSLRLTTAGDPEIKREGPGGARFGERLKSFPGSRFAFPILGGLLVVMILLSVSVGAVEISPWQSLAILARKIGLELPFSFTAQQESVLLAIRLPRIVLGLAVGAALAVAGAVLQSLFRNPLADPGLIGVSGGSMLTVSTALVLGETFSLAALGSPFFLPVAAFFGGLSATAFIYRIGKSKPGASVATMLLAGIAVNAFAVAGIGLMSFLATDAQLRNITFWNLGSLGGATWISIAAAAPLIFVSVAFLLRMARSFNVILLGEAEARHLGVNTEKLKWQAICLVALAVGAAVAVAGAIGFVGLIVPHLLRLTIGADHRSLLKNSALLGANFVLAADLLARIALAPAEMPIGIITALLGGPFFIALLLKKNV